MKKYIKPVAEIEKFESSDIITLSGVNIQGAGEDGIDERFTPTGLGFSKHN